MPLPVGCDGNTYRALLRRQALRLLLAANYTVTECALIFGLSDDDLLSGRTDEATHGPEVLHRPARPRNGSRDARIMELHKQGRTKAQIAKEVGMTWQGVYYALKRSAD